MIMRRIPTMCLLIGGACAVLAGVGCQREHNVLDLLTEVSTADILEQAQLDFEQRRYDDALALYKWVIQRDPDNAEYHYLAGMCLLLTRRHAQSEFYFRTAVAKAPGMLAARRGLAMSLSGRGRLQQAADVWREACRLNAERAEAFIELGRGEHAAGDLEAALAAFNTAVRLEPGNATAHLELGLFFEAVGRIDPALAQVRIAHRLDPGDPRLRVRIAFALERIARRAADRQPVGPR